MEGGEVRFRIRGRVWGFVRRKLPSGTFGLCDPPAKPGKRISIDNRLRGRLEMDTTIHELLHAACWDLSEEAVDETATDISRALWRIGYRKVDLDD